MIGCPCPRCMRYLRLYEKALQRATYSVLKNYKRIRDLPDDEFRINRLKKAVERISGHASKLGWLI